MIVISIKMLRLFYRISNSHYDSQTHYMMPRTLVLIMLLFASGQTYAAEEVNIYSARKEALIKPLLDRFSDKYQIQVNLVTGKGDALLTRMQAEGKNSPADLLITTDVGRLHRAKEAGVLQAFSTPALLESVPAAYRDSENLWYGLSLRSRVIVYAPERVDATLLSSYENLADEQWKGRICIRSSSNIYNQSLVAGMIAHHGLQETETWLKAFVRNFARSPQGGDRDQIRAVASGQCDLAIVNTYYLGAMLNSDDEDERELAQQVRLFWPNQESYGTHMNVSGVGLSKYAPNKSNAIKLVEFLVSDDAQYWYAQTNHEYPVKSGVAVSDTLEEWGEYKADTLAVEKLGELNAAALMAMDRAGWK